MHFELPMQSKTNLYLSATCVTGLIALIASAHNIHSMYFHKRPAMTPRQRRLLRQKLPKDLMSWRIPGSCESENRIWFTLEQLLFQEGLELWPHEWDSITVSPKNSYPILNGFANCLQARGVAKGPGTAFHFKRFSFINSLCRAVRTREGHDVIARVIVVGADGKEHLDIVRKLGTAPLSYFSNNHCLPLLREVVFEDVVFGLFPRAGQTTCEDAYSYWGKNSVGDILNMMLQCLEALDFIHGLKIAHRDAFKDNFLVQWYPESLLSMKISPSRPRVYLIDFEFAIEFPSTSTVEECMVSGLPLPKPFTNAEKYARPRPPIMRSNRLYSPFKLDVWQLGISYSTFKSTIPAIDEILLEMYTNDPDDWMDASTALEKLSSVVHGMKPSALLNPPAIVESAY